MDGSFAQRQEMRPLPRMIPEQIVAGAVLQLPCLELEQRILAAFDQNPALTLEEVSLCPACGAPAPTFPCPACGHRPEREEDVPVVLADDWEGYRQAVHDAEIFEPFSTVAGRRTLRDDLREQWRVVSAGDARTIGLYLIDCLDETGYMREPLIDIAQKFRASVPEIERVLRDIQRLDPAGVGARDLRECLLVQCTAMEEAGNEGPAALANRVLSDAWEELCAGRIAAISAALERDPEEVQAAVEWIRGNLKPYPALTFRLPWEHLAPRSEPEVAPDVIIRFSENGFIVEIVETSRFRLGVDTEFHRLNDAFRKQQDQKPQAQHVRRAVSDARFLIDAIAQRRRTLYQVMSAVAEAQAGFLRYGRAHLKPLMQKTIAAELGVHESTVCRALADKLVRLPSGETVPTTAFFDDASPVKDCLAELVAREDPAKPLSDSRLAQLLAENGHTIARRTVAKYRESLRIPPLEMRQRSAVM